LSSHALSHSRSRPNEMASRQERGRQQPGRSRRKRRHPTSKRKRPPPTSGRSLKPPAAARSLVGFVLPQVARCGLGVFCFTSKKKERTTESQRTPRRTRTLFCLLCVLCTTNAQNLCERRRVLNGLGGEGFDVRVSGGQQGGDDLSALPADLVAVAFWHLVQ